MGRGLTPSRSGTSGRRDPAGQDRIQKHEHQHLPNILSTSLVLKCTAKVRSNESSLADPRGKTIQTSVRLDARPSVNVAAAIFLAYFAFISIIRRLFVII